MEQCKFFTKFRGPYRQAYLAWFYLTLRGDIAVEKDSPQKLLKSIPAAIFHPSQLESSTDSGRPDQKQMRKLLASSQSLFLTDLYGLHVLAEAYGDMLEQVLKYAVWLNDPRMVEDGMRILAQLMSLPPNFVVEDTANPSPPLPGGVGQVLDRYMRLRKQVAKLLDSPLKEFKHPPRQACMYFWICTLNVLENGTQEEAFGYAKELLQYTFAEGFDSGLLDKGRCALMYAILEMVKVVIMSMEADPEASEKLRILMYQIMGIAEGKVPAEKVGYRRLDLKRTDDYEKILCSLIRLSMYTSNLILGLENVFASREV